MTRSPASRRGGRRVLPGLFSTTMKPIDVPDFACAVDWPLVVDLLKSLAWPLVMLI